ncbi:hypothetical protein [Vreelandella sp. EE7]
MRSSYAFFVASLFFLALILLYMNSSTALYCGIREKKPELALGLSPSWFDDRFQLMIGNTEVISSTNKEKPVFDKWVKGARKFKIIVGYNTASIGRKFYFKAIDWEKNEELFSLQRYSPGDGEEYVYEVLSEEGVEQEERWVRVSHWQCIRGKYLGFTIIFLFLLFFINFVLIIKGALNFLIKLFSRKN